MTEPVTLTFRHLPRSGALESSARDIGNRLRLVNSRLMACHIVFEGKADAQGDGGPYVVKIHLSVPGAQIHADSEPRSGEEHSEVRDALQAAYQSAKRQLENLRRQRARHDNVAF